MALLETSQLLVTIGGDFFRYSNEDIRIKQRVQINYGLPPPTNQKIGKRKTLLANRLTPPPLAFAPLPVSLHSRIFFFRLYEITMDLGGDAGVIFACRGGGGGGDKVKVYGGAHNELLNLVM